MNTNQRFVALFRISLGISQMTMSLVTLGLYFQTGLNVWSIGALVVTGLLMAASRISFQDEHVDFAMSNRFKRSAAEFVGTFCLVFAGTGAIVINDATGGAVTHVGVALTFGLIVLAMIYTFGDISGAHLNPAVTLGFFAARRFNARDVAPYIVSQILGALAASELLRGLFPQHPTLGATNPAGLLSQSFILEAVLTFILMLVILSLSIGAKEKGVTAGIAVGAVIGLEALFAGPICGASMNPARSLAPALVSGHVGVVWLYIIAPIIGALLAVPICICVREKGCCSTLTAQEFSST